MGQGTDDAVERFDATSGQVSGWFAVLVAAVLGVVGLLGAREGSDTGWVIAAIALVFGLLAWASLLRPRISVVGPTLVLRNMLETVHVPLAAIESTDLRQVLVVRTADRRFVSPAVGRTRRQIHRRPRLDPLAPRIETDAPRQPRGVVEDHPRYVQDRVDQLAAAARRDARGEPPPAVRREPAWLEIGLLAGSVVVLVLAIVL